MFYACVKCQRLFHVRKNGVYIEERMPSAQAWVPYKLWAGDLYECEACGAQLFVPARLPLAEHYQPDYKEMIARHQPITHIDDCPGPFRGKV